MECVTTPTCSILGNGVPQGYIKPSRGIRQGDSLSSYLFIICAEGLSSLIMLKIIIPHIGKSWNE